MRWAVLVVRFLIGISLVLGLFIVPRTPLWLFVGGISYVLGVLLVITALDADLDILAYLAIGGVTGPGTSPLSARSLLMRVLAVVAFWLVLLAVGWILLPFSIVAWRENGAVRPWHFLVGTLLGTVAYLAAIGWYRKSMRRRYGY